MRVFKDFADMKAAVGTEIGLSDVRNGLCESLPASPRERGEGKARSGSCFQELGASRE
jgi:hypothetical protein